MKCDSHVTMTVPPAALRKTTFTKPQQGCQAAGADSVQRPARDRRGGAVVVPFIHNAGLAQLSKPKKCAYLRFTYGVWTSGTYADSRCKQKPQTVVPVSGA